MSARSIGPQKSSCVLWEDDFEYYPPTFKKRKTLENARDDVQDSIERARTKLRKLERRMAVEIEFVKKQTASAIFLTTELNAIDVDTAVYPYANTAILPNELKYLILEHLDWRSIQCLARVCVVWRNFIRAFARRLYISRGTGPYYKFYRRRMTTTTFSKFYDRPNCVFPSYMQTLTVDYVTSRTVTLPSTLDTFCINKVSFTLQKLNLNGVRRLFFGSIRNVGKNSLSKSRFIVTDHLFSGCERVETACFSNVKLYGGCLHAFTGVKTLIFSTCMIDSVVFPSSVTKVVFVGCYISLCAYFTTVCVEQVTALNCCINHNHVYVSDLENAQAKFYTHFHAANRINIMASTIDQATSIQQHVMEENRGDDRIRYQIDTCQALQRVNNIIQKAIGSMRISVSITINFENAVLKLHTNFT